MRPDPRQDLIGCFHAALAAVHGRSVTAAALRRLHLTGPVRLVAVGKAAASMAAGAFDALGAQIHDGLVVTKEGHGGDALGLAVRCLEAAHPVPDERSLAAGQALLAMLSQSGPHELILFLLSGGSSSLVEVLPEGVTLDVLRQLNQALLGSGLPIDQVNAARKRLSLIKGGRLAAYLRGPALALVISDVPDNDLSVIGSGMLVWDAAGERPVAGGQLPEPLRALLNNAPPPLPRDHPGFQRVDMHVVVDSAAAAAAAAAAGRDRGYAVQLVDTRFCGDALDAGRVLARSLRDGPPGLYVWAGETTVRLPPRPGRGGRNQSLALAAALELEGCDGVYLLAGATDGTDGPGVDAGALVDGGTTGRGSGAGMDPLQCLMQADAGTFLEVSGDLLNTGPTGTNVMDLVLGLKVSDSE